jgi:hypothetical protein
MEATVQKEVSDAVLAPVVVNAKTEEGVRAFLSYVDALTRHSNVEIAEAESHRLRPYFSAMSEYVIEALQKPPRQNPQSLR